MAEDIVGGTSGSVSFIGNNFNVDIDAWSMRIGAEDTIAWRTFASKWKNKKNTGYGVSGQFRGTVQYNASNTRPMPMLTGGVINADAFEGVSMALTAETGCEYALNVNITIVDLQRVASDRMIGTFSFEGTAAPGQQWDETA